LGFTILLDVEYKRIHGYDVVMNKAQRGIDTIEYPGLHEGENRN